MKPPFRFLKYVLAIFLMFRATHAVADDVIGKVVSQVSFESPLNLDYDDLISSVSLHSGDVISESELAKTLASLQSRQIFEKVKMTSTEDESDHRVHLVFHLVPYRFIRAVEFYGNWTLEDTILRRKVSVPIGSRVTAELVELAQKQIERAYLQEGFYQAAVNIRVAPSVAPQVRLVFDINEGHRSKISHVSLAHVSARSALSEEVATKLKKVSEDYVGSPASVENLKALTRSLLLRLRTEGYLQATVKQTSASYSPLNRDVEVNYSVHAKTPITIYFNGNRHFSAEQLLEPLHMDTRTVPFSPNAVSSLCRDIEELYQAEGFAFARAESTRLPSDETGREQIQISIEEGTQSQIKEIEISGNREIPESKLRDLMDTKPKGWWVLDRWAPGYLERGVLASDLAKIEAYYVDQGFPEVKADFDIIFDSSKQHITLKIRIEEGKRRHIGKTEIVWHGLAVAGDTSRAPLGFVLKLHSGQPLMRSAIEAEGARLQEYLYSLGYPTARVAVQIKPETSDIQFIVDTGKQIHISKIILEGNVFTHDEVIFRELKIAEGGLWRAKDISASETDLFQLGHFRSVSLVPTDGTLDESNESLSVRVVERDTGLLGFGVDVNSEDGLHLSSELGQRNLGGTGDSLLLGFDGYFKNGNRVLDAGRTKVVYGHPHVYGSESDIVIEGFGQFDVELLDEFSYDRMGSSATLQYPFSDRLSAKLGVLAYNENLFNVAPDVRIGDSDTGHSWYSFLKSELVYDRRNDPFNPRKGFRSAADFQIAATETGSDVNLLVFHTQHSTFTSLSPDLVWMNNLRFALARPFSDTEVVPLGQRIFLGGRNSLRGFSLRSLGPRGEQGNIVGGDTSFIYNSELQLDLAENIAGALFLDMGSVYLEENGSFQGNALSLDEIRYSPGFGFRYKTPIGPLSVDYGFALDRQFGESVGQLNFGIGGSF